MTTQATEPQSFEMISRRPDFRGLTFAQQRFIEVYLTTEGNSKVAVLAAFPNCADKNVRTRISHLMAVPTIRRLLQVANGESEVDSILSEVGDAIRKSMRNDLKKGPLSIATKDMVKFFVQEMGQRLKPAEAEDGEPTYSIGELVKQDGKLYRITAVEIPEGSADGI